jgi:hypothetical protein
MGYPSSTVIRNILRIIPMLIVGKPGRVMAGWDETTGSVQKHCIPLSKARRKRGTSEEGH